MNDCHYPLAGSGRNIVIAASSHVTRVGVGALLQHVLFGDRFTVIDCTLTALANVMMAQCRPTHAVLVLHDHRDMRSLVPVLPVLGAPAAVRWHILVFCPNAVGLAQLSRFPGVNLIDARQSVSALLHALRSSLSNTRFISESLQPYFCVRPLAIREQRVLRHLRRGLSLEHIAVLMGCRKKKRPGVPGARDAQIVFEKSV
ncbi:hypothetical protein K1Y38_27110 [Serratia marcescens]|uniref:hypothetical protein n=1 Tax=Serratia marcescens TaxID=615 RepID=UPI002237C5EB|nr:hypothetical protein [Serratia marcescens]MCW6016420.1 hypothetical protein [Serratia marcescens]MCW6025655.1 hypothetical protein [Serratia marcescens]